jgi:hypothetical protein
MNREPAKRTWTIEADPNTGHPDEREVFQMHQDLAVILTRVGGTISGMAVRREIEPGVFTTVGFVYRWESFAPAVRAAPEPEPEEAPEPEAEIEVVEAEPVTA